MRTGVLKDTGLNMCRGMPMCIDMYAYGIAAMVLVHVCTHVYTHVYAHVYTHFSTYVYTLVYTLVYTNVSLHERNSVHKTMCHSSW